MKNRLLLAVLLIAFYNNLAFGQDPKDKTLYSQSQSLDTSITPDFYEVEVTISEYYIYPEEKRGSKTVKIGIDSAKQMLLSELAKIGIKDKISLSQVIDRDYQSYTAEALLKASYKFIVISKDSIEIIYKYLTADLPIASLRRFDITPMLTPYTIKRAQIELEKVALDRVNIDVQKFAEKNKLAIQKIENYEIEFSRKYKYEDYYNLQGKSLAISFLNPVYTLTVKHTFLLK